MTDVRFAPKRIAFYVGRNGGTIHTVSTFRVYQTLMTMRCSGNTISKPAAGAGSLWALTIVSRMSLCYEAQ